MRICPLLLAPFVGFWYTLHRRYRASGRRLSLAPERGLAHGLSSYDLAFDRCHRVHNRNKKEVTAILSP